MNDFVKLKSILLQDEIDRIEKITNDISYLKDQQKRDILVDKLSLIISDIISKSIQENQGKLYASLQPIISKGILDELNSSNNNLKEILFPIISSAIHDQVHKQKDSIVDALYPIMGNMISKYVSSAFSDMMYEVNDKIQNSLSFSRLKRKIKSKIYRISEAELLLRETNFIDIKTIFLIHKESGLLITDLHKSDKKEIEEVEMVASMLSAIRSFVNDWISSHNSMNEISEIEYGNSSISIESAGSCYIAIVTNGQADMKDRVSKVLSQIVDRHSQELAQYDGDTNKIDIADIRDRLSTLFAIKDENTKRRFPIISFLLLIMIISYPLYYYAENSYKEHTIKMREDRVRRILDEYHIHVYDLQIETDKDNTIIIDGLLLKDSDRNKTNIIFRGIEHINNIKSIENTFYQNYNRRELKSIVTFINKKFNSNITYTFKKNTIKFYGTIIDTKRKIIIMSILIDKFGKGSVIFDFNVLPKINDRVYFDKGSDIILKEYNTILNKVASIHRDNSNYFIKISAYTDSIGSKTTNKKISFKRAEQVKNRLIELGVDTDKIIVEYRPAPPDDILSTKNKKSRSLSRCVIFNWEIDNDNQTEKNHLDGKLFSRKNITYTKICRQ
jgi:flagellar motor protein MotB